MSVLARDHDSFQALCVDYLPCAYCIFIYRSCLIAQPLMSFTQGSYIVLATHKQELDRISEFKHTYLLARHQPDAFPPLLDVLGKL